MQVRIGPYQVMLIVRLKSVKNILTEYMTRQLQI